MNPLQVKQIRKSRSWIHLYKTESAGLLFCRRPATSYAAKKIVAASAPALCRAPSTKRCLHHCRWLVHSNRKTILLKTSLQHSLAYRMHACSLNCGRLWVRSLEGAEFFLLAEVVVHKSASMVTHYKSGRRTALVLVLLLAMAPQVLYFVCAKSFVRVTVRACVCVHLTFRTDNHVRATACLAVCGGCVLTFKPKKSIKAEFC